MSAGFITPPCRTKTESAPVTDDAAASASIASITYCFRTAVVTAFGDPASDTGINSTPETLASRFIAEIFMPMIVTFPVVAP